MVRVIKKVGQCNSKLDKLITLALEILETAAQHRLSQQVLQFLKYFRDFIMLNDHSHINLDTRVLDN